MNPRSKKRTRSFSSNDDDQPAAAPPARRRKLVPVVEIPVKPPSSRATRAAAREALRAVADKADDDSTPVLETDDASQKAAPTRRVRTRRGQPTPPASPPTSGDASNKDVIDEPAVPKIAELSTTSTDPSSPPDSAVPSAPSSAPASPSKPVAPATTAPAPAPTSSPPSRPASTTPDVALIVGRDAQRNQITAFLSRRCTDPTASDGPAALYIAGSPGTGKTALTSEILASPAFRDRWQINVNCMALPTPANIYVAIATALAERLATKKETKRAPPVGKALDRVRELVDRLRDPCILLLDELDGLITGQAHTHQTVLYTLFELTHKCPHLILVGIANSIDLTDRLLPLLATHTGGQAAARSLMPEIVTFPAYSATDLVAIVRARFAGQMQEPAMAFLARKIAAASSDVRKAITIARTAVRLAVAEAKGATETAVVAKVPHVVRAFQVASSAGSGAGAGGGSAAVVKVRGLNFTAKLALVAAIVALPGKTAKRTALAETPAVNARPFAETTLVDGEPLPPTTASTPASSRPTTPGPTASGLSGAQLFETYRALGRPDPEQDKRKKHVPPAVPLPNISEAEFWDVVTRLESAGLLTLSAAPGAGKRKAAGAGMRGTLVGLAVTAEELVRGLTTAAPGAGVAAASHVEVIRQLLEVHDVEMEGGAEGKVG
ncbi:AAA ATPase [Allomyces javanicus]|nr:AAA ATPase [Allomyces javanicus]